MLTRRPLGNMKGGICGGPAEWIGRRGLGVYESWENMAQAEARHLHSAYLREGLPGSDAGYGGGRIEYGVGECWGRVVSRRVSNSPESGP